MPSQRANISNLAFPLATKISESTKSASFTNSWHFEAEDGQCNWSSDTLDRIFDCRCSLGVQQPVYKVRSGWRVRAWATRVKTSKFFRRPVSSLHKAQSAYSFRCKPKWINRLLLLTVKRASEPSESHLQFPHIFVHRCDWLCLLWRGSAVSATTWFGYCVSAMWCLPLHIGIVWGW